MWAKGSLFSFFKIFMAYETVSSLVANLTSTVPYLNPLVTKVATFIIVSKHSSMSSSDTISIPFVATTWVRYITVLLFRFSAAFSGVPALHYLLSLLYMFRFYNSFLLKFHFLQFERQYHSNCNYLNVRAFHNWKYISPHNEEKENSNTMRARRSTIPLRTIQQ